MRMMLRECRLASRLLWRARGFTAVAVLTLGLGIGASTAIYSVVHGVLFRPLPFPEPDRIVRVWQVSEQGGRSNFSDPNFEDLRDRSRSFASIAQFASYTVSVAGGAAPVRTGAAAVSAGFFEALGVGPVLGRAFTADERRAGGPPAVIVSHAFWRDQLGARRELSGTALRAEERTYEVVGVLPPGAVFPEGVDLFTPRELERRYPSRTAHNWQVLGRLAPGVPLDRARAEITTIARELKREHGLDTWMTDAAIVPLHDALVTGVKPLLLLVLGAVILLLAVACANVANLMLARAATRQREIAVRAALGAAKGQLFAPLVAEASLLAAAGGTLGLLLADAGLAFFLAAEPGGLPRLGSVGLHAPVFLFAVVVCVATAVGLATTAGWRLMRRDPAGWLRTASRGEAAGSGLRTRRVLMVAQLALSLVLLSGAGLLARSFVRLLQQEIGFRADGLLTVAVNSPKGDGEAGLARLAALNDSFVEALRGLPGVASAGGINAFPMTGSGANGIFLVIDGAPPAGLEDFARLAKEPGRAGDALYRAATPDYFRTMGIPLVRGRLFGAHEDRESPHAAVISQSLAARQWPGEDPIGKRLAFGNMDGDPRLITVVGIVGDVRERGFDAVPRPVIYVNARQRPATTGSFTIVARTEGDPAAVIAPARAAFARIAPDVPPRFRTGGQVLSGSVADRRLGLLLIGGFAAAALILAVVGLYGVTAYVVAQRTQEIGVRMALGARPGDVQRLVLGQGLALVAIGTAIGLGVALASGRLLRTLLFEITPADPLTYAGVVLLLGAAALAACAVPARRATRIDPLVALRPE